MTESRIEKLALGLGLLAIALAASYLAFSDEQAEQQHYAEMVCQGAWPDYRRLQPKCPVSRSPR